MYGQPVYRKIYMYQETTLWPKYTGYLGNKENWHIPSRRHACHREWGGKAEMWKESLFPKRYVYAAEGSATRYTGVRNHDYSSGNTESKATHRVSQPIFLPPGIAASQTRKNAVILGTERLSHIFWIHPLGGSLLSPQLPPAVLRARPWHPGLPLSHTWLLPPRAWRAFCSPR